MKKKIDISRDKTDFESGKIGPLFRKMFFPTLVDMMMVRLDGASRSASSF